MSVWGNPVSPGGIGNAAAAVRAVYLPGSAVPAAKGTRVLTGDSSGAFLFLLPEAGTWTFAAGDKTRQLAVSAGSVYTVNLVSLLGASAQEDILAESLGAYYESGSPAWGGFSLSGAGYGKSGDAVVLPSGAYAACPLGQTNLPITAYAVFRQDAARSNWPSMIAAAYSESQGCCPGFNGQNGTVWTSVYGAAYDRNTGVSALAWNCMAFSINESKLVSFYLNGAYLWADSCSTAGASVLLNTAANGARPNAGSYRYAAVVSGAEDRETVLANMEHIMAYYEIGS